MSTVYFLKCLSIFFAVFRSQWLCFFIPFSHINQIQNIFICLVYSSNFNSNIWKKQQISLVYFILCSYITFRSNYFLRCRKIYLPHCLYFFSFFFYYYYYYYYSNACFLMTFASWDDLLIAEWPLQNPLRL